MKILAALSCLTIAFTSLTNADTRVVKVMGSARVVINSDGLAISVGGHEYRAATPQLPLEPRDCPQAVPGKECVRLWDGIAWDEAREVLYLAAATDIGQNKPWMIFSYDLRSATITRIGDEEGGGFAGGMMSPSGRYPAYIGYDGCGVCCTTSRLVLLDTQTRDAGTFRLPAASRDGNPRGRQRDRWPSRRYSSVANAGGRPTCTARRVSPRDPRSAADPHTAGHLRGRR